jgi:hypothetical protein
MADTQTSVDSPYPMEEQTTHSGAPVPGFFTQHETPTASYPMDEQTPQVQQQMASQAIKPQYLNKDVPEPKLTGEIANKPIPDNGFTNALNYYHNAAVDGGMDLARQMAGANVAVGLITPEDALKDYSKERLAKLHDPINQAFPEPDFYGMIGATVRTLPTLGAVLSGGYAGAASEAGIGALTGVATGPAAEIAVPVFGLTFAIDGAAKGVAVTSAMLNGGGQLMDSLEAGVPYSKAILPAAAYGLATAPLQVAKFGALNSATKTGFAQIARSKEGLAAIGKYVASVTKNMGIQLGIGEIQAGAKSVADMLSAASTATSDQNFAHPDFMKVLGDAAINGLKTIPLTTLGAGAIGSLQGNHIKAQMDKASTLAEHLAVHGELLKQQINDTPEGHLQVLKSKEQTAKAEEKLSKLNADYNQAKLEKSPTKAIQASIEVATHELAIARNNERMLQPPEPKLDTAVLQGHITKDVTQLKKIVKVTQSKIDAIKSSIAFDEQTGKPIEPEQIAELKKAYKERNQAKDDLAEAKHGTIQIDENIKTLKAEINKMFTKALGLQNKSAKAASHLDEVKARELELEASIVTDDLAFWTQKLKELVAKREQIEADSLKEAKSDLKKQIGLIKKSKGKLARGEETQDMLLKVADFYNGSDKENTAVDDARQKYQDALSAMSQEAFPLGIDRDLANLADVRDKNAAQIRKDANSIGLSLRTGKSGRLKQIETLKGSIEANRKFVREVSQGNQPVSEDDNTPAVKPARYHTIEDIVGFFGGWRHKLEEVSIDATIEQQQKLIELLGVRDRVKARDKSVSDRVGRLFGHLEEHTGLMKSDIQELFRLGSKDKVRVGFFRKLIKNDVDVKYMRVKAGSVKTDTAPYTINEAVKLLMQLEDPRLDNGFKEGNGFTNNTANEIKAQLDKYNTAYAKMVPAFQAFYQEMHGPLNDVYKRVEGVELPRNERYSGYATRNAGEEKQAIKFDIGVTNKKPFKSKGVGKPKQTLKATNNSKSIVAVDVLHDALDYVNTTENYIAFKEASKDIFVPILTDPVTKRILERKFGPALHSAILSHYEDITQTSVQKKADWMVTMDKAFRNYSFIKLMAKPLMIGKHAFSQVTGVLHIPFGAYAKGLSTFYFGEGGLMRGSLKNVASITNASDQYAIRAADMNSVHAGGLEPDRLMSPLEKNAKGAAMFPITFGSKTGYVPLVFAAKEYYLSLGFTEAEALSKAEFVGEDTQVSGAVDMQSNLARTGAGVITRFHQQQISFGVANLLAWQKFSRNPTSENFMAASKTSVVAAVGIGIFPLVDALYIATISQDEHEKSEALFRFYLESISSVVPLSTFPYAGDAIKNSTTELWNQVTHDNYHYYDINWAVGDIGNKTVKLLKDLGHTVFSSAPKDEKATAEEWLNIGLDFSASWFGLAAAAFGVYVPEPMLKFGKRLINRSELQQHHYTGHVQ